MEIELETWNRCMQRLIVNVEWVRISGAAFTFDSKECDVVGRVNSRSHLFFTEMTEEVDLNCKPKWLSSRFEAKFN